MSLSLTSGLGVGVVVGTVVSVGTYAMWGHPFLAFTLGIVALVATFLWTIWETPLFGE